MDDEADPTAPRLIAGRYELGALIGRGGAASVRRARDTVLERDVAVKILPTEAGTADRDRRRSEAKLLASLNHPSLVTLYDAVATDDATFLVMELMEGGTLGRVLRAGPLQPEVAAGVARDVAGALAHIHARGIVHRDVKPANILLAAEAGPLRAKLSDFGIAKLLETAPSAVSGVLGTAHYLSPEQARGATVGPPSDVYSLGLTLIEACTGAPPFPGTAVESLTARLLRDPEVPGGLGYEWRSLLTAMTARDPAARPSAQQVAERAVDLATIVDGGAPLTAADVTAPITLDLATRTALLPQVPVTERTTPPRRRSRRGGLLGIAASAVVVGSIAALALTTGVLGPKEAAAEPSAPTRPAPAVSSSRSADPRPTPVVSRSIPPSPSAPAAPTSTTPSSTTVGKQSTGTSNPAVKPKPNPKGNGKADDEPKGKGKGKDKGKSRG